MSQLVQQQQRLSSKVAYSNIDRDRLINEGGEHTAEGQEAQPQEQQPQEPVVGAEAGHVEPNQPLVAMPEWFDMPPQQLEYNFAQPPPARQPMRSMPSAALGSAQDEQDRDDHIMHEWVTH